MTRREVRLTTDAIGAVEHYIDLMSTYQKLLQEQIRNEFTAAQQYTAVAVWFDDQDLPQLASHFYKQSLEERNHAMMMVQYLLDKDIRPNIPGVGDVVNWPLLQFAL